MKGVLFITLAFFSALFSGLGSWSCSPGGNPEKIETLTLADVPTELNAIVYVAEVQKFFGRNGLQVNLKGYDSGAASVAGMLNGEADLALAAEFPIVRQVFNKNDIVCFGTITKYENTYIIWRTDSGIHSIQDLKGKRIGVTLETISEFYLGRTLELNGMNIEQVTLVDTKAAESEKTFLNGEVDAVVVWEPWVTQISQRIGKEAIIRPLQSGQYGYWNLVSTSDWTKKHPHVLSRLMKSLVQAEDYLMRHRDEAKGIVRKQMNFDAAYIEIVWPRYQFALSLDQSLITAMEDEARWMIKNNFTNQRLVPDFMNYIHEDGLRAAKPDAVTIIR